jgi:hypothetical protein
MSDRYMKRDDGVIFIWTEALAKKKNFREVEDPFEQEEEIIAPQGSYKLVMEDMDKRMREANCVEKKVKPLGRPRKA